MPPVLIAGLYSGAALGQAMTILGADSYARDCFMAAGVAAQVHSADRGELRNCTLALESAHLSQRDLLATYVNRGIIFAALGRYDSAEQDYASAIDLDPQSGEVYVNRGNLAFLKQDYQRAIREYDKGLELGVSANQVAFFNRGMAFEHLEQYEHAESDYRRAIELAPEWTQARARLDLLLLRLRTQR